MNQIVEANGANTPQHDILVFIARAQPLHDGHVAVIKEAMSKSKFVAILLGSAYAARSLRNPFTYEERRKMILDSVPDPLGQLRIQPLQDAILDEEWRVNVQRAVGVISEMITAVLPVVQTKFRIGLIGYNKDATSHYLRLFPQWGDYVNVQNYMNQSATPIRNAFLSNIGPLYVKNLDGHREGDKPQEHLVPTPVRQFLAEFLKTPAYQELRQEYEHDTKNKVLWANIPYPSTHNMVTTDALVLWSGHVLLVERGGYPGKGQWALPGGHLENSERIVDGMIRELQEETKIGVPEAVLRGCITASYVYDDPLRSTRGRTITHAFRINLKDSIKQPNITGGDDAIRAFWHPIGSVPSFRMFEDHYQIIEHLRNL